MRIAPSNKGPKGAPATTTPMSAVCPIAKPLSSAKRILAALAPVPAASRVCKLIVPTAFSALFKIMSWPAALTVTAQKFPLLILILAVWVMGPVEVRLTVPAEMIPIAVVAPIVVRSSVALV